MNNITVNGKTLKQIETELRADFADSEFKTNDADGSIYLPREAYEDRLASVIGVMQYDTVTTPGHVELINGVPHAMTSMTLTVYADDGEILRKWSRNGAKQLIIVKDSGRPKSFKSDLTAAETEAFKSICQSLGMATHQLKAKNAKGGTGRTQQRQQPALPAGVPEGEQNIVVTLKSTFSKGNGYIKAQAVDSQGRILDVMAFSKTFPEIEKKCSVDNFIGGMKAGQSFQFSGSYNQFNGRLQAIFAKDLAVVQRAA